MAEGHEADAPHGPLGHAAEERIPQLTEKHVGKARRAVGEYEAEEQARGNAAAGAHVEAVDQVLEQKRDSEQGALGGEQAGERQPDARPIAGEQRDQPLEHPPVEASRGWICQGHASHGSAPGTCARDSLSGGGLIDRGNHGLAWAQRIAGSPRLEQRRGRVPVQAPAIAAAGRPDPGAAGERSANCKGSGGRRH